jgi:signal transduction histidine kinase
MQSLERTILLISNVAAWCVAARHGLESREPHVRVAAVSTVDAAERIVADAAPVVILLDENTFPVEPRERLSESLRIETLLGALAAHAPVVIIGAEHGSETAPLVIAARVDFLPHSQHWIAEAMDLADQRWRQPLPDAADSRNSQAAALPSPQALPDEMASEAFGEVLRHELNNPLTGILGNAELLLAEVRRTNDGHFPNGGQQRLETIAALAVRLRETVRRLSQDWETRNRRMRRRAVQPRTAY